MQQDITSLYGSRVRIRVCGLCWQNNRLLLINHRLYANQDFWAPPGGGLEFGQGVEDALKREFNEETGLKIELISFRFVVEFIKPPLHAIEIFFDVQVKGGELKKGKDPEMPDGNQIIHEVAFADWETITAIPEAEKHGIFKRCIRPKDLQTLTGFHTI